MEIVTVSGDNRLSIVLMAVQSNVLLDNDNFFISFTSFKGLGASSWEVCTLLTYKRKTRSFEGRPVLS